MELALIFPSSGGDTDNINQLHFLCKLVFNAWIHRDFFQSWSNDVQRNVNININNIKHANIMWICFLLCLDFLISRLLSEFAWCSQILENVHTNLSVSLTKNYGVLLTSSITSQVLTWQCVFLYFLFEISDKL